ncbi:hypothetical protein GFU47_28880, partial [Escherichia coli]|nr:hypothetical protein [Escherichia coli]
MNKIFKVIWNPA